MTTAVHMLRDHFGTHATRFGLDRRALVIEPVFNHGGFVNASFKIDDGRRHCHLKLARDPADLATYWKHAKLLADRYRSPQALAWVDVPACGSGILFDGLTIRTADNASLALATELARLLEKLHRDTDLAVRLSAAEQSCAHTYHATFGRRFAADLEMVAKDRPPFVSAATFAYMCDEARALTEIVSQHGAFAAPAISPIHSDIWANNVLVEPHGRWWLIDWDDLDIGDPALDIGMLLEFAGGGGERWVEPAALGLDLSDAMMARTRIYRRASRLDWVIDSLADWLDAGDHPDWTDQARAQKEADHVTALARYRATYTRSPQAEMETR